VPGLTFGDAPPPDPQSPLVTWLDEWAESLARHSRKTVAGYVSDVAGFVAVLTGVVKKRMPDVRAEDVDEAALEAAGRFGCNAGSYARARALFGLLVLADLHPKSLARAVNRHLADHAPATTKRAASAWSSYYRYLTGQQILASNPMDAAAVEVPSRPAGDPTPLTYEEAQRVFAVCAQPDPTRSGGGRSPAVWTDRGLRLPGPATVAV
jgi:site-specific recombinase XerD